MSQHVESDKPRSRSDVGGRNLPTAIASGVVLGGLFLGTLFWHPLAFSVLVGVLLVVGLVEGGRALGEAGIEVATAAIVLGAVAVLVGSYVDGTRGQSVGLIVLFVAVVGSQLLSPDRHDVMRVVSTSLFLGLWVAFLASFAILLITREVDPIAATLAVCGAAIFGDIGGFAFGVTFGRHKIAPSLSPNKTWEGLIGGIVTSSVLAAAVLPRVGDLFDVPTAILLGVVGTLGGFLGDLLESMMKRDLGVKDLGRIIPGHGGILDRVDGILVALPLGWLVLEFMG